MIFFLKSVLDTDCMQQQKSKENSFPTFLINDTHNAEERDRDKYSVKYWYHGHFIIDGKFILCFVYTPRDNFHLY